MDICIFIYNIILLIIIREKERYRCRWFQWITDLKIPEFCSSILFARSSFLDFPCIGSDKFVEIIRRNMNVKNIYDGTKGNIDRDQSVALERERRC